MADNDLPQDSRINIGKWIIIILGAALIGIYLFRNIYNKATGYTKNFNAEIASIAKKDLKAGKKLDGEGGYCARGRLISSKRSKTKEFYQWDSQIMRF